MQIDPEQFTRHYATLSDEALLAIDPADLVDVARQRWEQELRSRGLADTEDAEEAEASGEGDFDDADPAVSDDWKERAICACSFVQASAQDSAAASAAAADAALSDAGIPCFIDSNPGDPSQGTTPRYLVMIPASLRLLAESVLDKELFNAALEAEWQAHFDELSDEDLRALDADELCAGMLDRAARLKKTFAAELLHRGIRR